MLLRCVEFEAEKTKEKVLIESVYNMDHCFVFAANIGS